MGYPYDKTYLEMIQESKEECSHIKEAYYVLVKKYLRDNNIPDEIDLTTAQRFAILGEAFESESSILQFVQDTYHFMWDVLDELLTPKKKGDSNGTDTTD